MVINQGKMSLWGVGPLFGALCLLVTLPAFYFSLRFSEVFAIPWCPVLFYAAGGISFLFGLWMWICAGRRIDDYIRKGVLADKGFYGLVRNPVYSGIIFTAGGIFLCTRSLLLIGLPVVFYLILKLLLIKEERTLAAVFGDQYGDYRKKINSIIPKPWALICAFFYPVPSKKIFDNLYAVKSRDVNLFVISDDGTLVCIDAGYRNKNILKEFDRLNLDPDRVSAVFLTHSDTDHAGGLGFFKNAEVYLGKDEEALVNGKQHRFGKIYKNRKITMPYSLLKNNDIQRIGNTAVKAVNTPGHTAGHMAYLVNGKYLFTGDAVLIQNGRIRPFYRILSMNHCETRKSAEKIPDIDNAEWIFTAHSGYLKKS